MRKTLLLLLPFLFFYLVGFAQRFQQYNSGTLYGSFENPSQAAFIPDSSRQFASNFFVPNFYINSYLKGNAQATLKSRAFLGYYNNKNLEIGQGRLNPTHADLNVYVFMFKAYTSSNGKQEIGVSYQVRADGRANVTDETIALFNGSPSFTQPNYTNVFNSNGSYEAYHQFSATYREQVTKNFSVGVKLSALLGVAYNKIDITGSSIQFSREPGNTNGYYNNAEWGLAGSFRSNFLPGEFNVHKKIESFQNPGAAISIGMTYVAPGGIILQGNLRDLGFIRWRARGGTFIDNFDNRTTPAHIIGLTTPNRESNVVNSLGDMVNAAPVYTSFNAPITGYADFSAAKKFMFGDDLTYTPTLIVSKQTFSQNLGGAWVNNVKYKSVGATVSGIYNYKTFDLGLQLAYQTPNAEFFIGSEQLTRSLNFLNASSGNNLSAVNNSAAYSGAGVYLGFSLKFGRLIERWRNETYSPTGGEQGPLGKAWTRIFHTN
ncbi:hypothetical protein HH214_17795 [Mucilaginibacter robiniae]|uniref:DUF5723 domain-containing protein n=1 Tax=Mucilaginibacter robiniae TaxID=2728022 RepID=A0A7L5E3A5_9SPHI|nr:DUF5723 family protein [Mucilaginibacter robiniae]QJD97595.1 hypothetical protein HH214_17795 [Mucilaginibacter robiniae]